MCIIRHNDRGTQHHSRKDSYTTYQQKRSASDYDRAYRHRWLTPNSNFYWEESTCFNCRTEGHPQSNCTRTICKLCGHYGIHNGYDNKPGTYCDMAAAKMNILLNSARPRTQSRSKSRTRNDTQQDTEEKTHKQKN